LFHQAFGELLVQLNPCHNYGRFLAHFFGTVKDIDRCLYDDLAQATLSSYYAARLGFYFDTTFGDQI